MTLKLQAGPLDDMLDRLAAFEPSGLPVLSLYLDARADEHGKDRFEPILRRELPERARSFPPHSPERQGFDRDIERIERYLRDELQPRANGVALFACSAASLFEAAQLEVPFDQTRLHVGDRPHLYPLARVLEQYRRYAAVLTDTNWARIFVFGLGRTLTAHEVTTRKTRRSDVGGWSQMRYQRHWDNFHLRHAKEVVEVLSHVVREEKIDEVVLAGEEIVMPLIRQHLPKDVENRVIDVVHLDVRAPESEVLATTLEALRVHDAQGDAEKVGRLVDEYRAGGLGVVGARDTLGALQAGQVDEVIVSAAPQSVRPAPGTVADSEALAAELVALARQTSAKITFVEDPGLLEHVGGVGALLRYRLAPELAAPPPRPPEGVRA